MNRTCSRTGLALVDSPSAPVFRVATTSYGALNPKLREEGEAVDSWARWDTLGRTVYAVDSRRAAFVEATSWARQEKPRPAPAQLSKTAQALGMTVAELVNDIDKDWSAISGMTRAWLPAGWREARRVYQIDFSLGSWINIAHSDTLMALSDSMREELYELGVPLGLTLSEVTSDKRAVTTAIAGWLRETVTLDDGTVPLGVCFPSKHGYHDGGSGTCWAYWLRETDHGLPLTGAHADSGTTIEADDEDFRYALELHNLDAR